MMFWKQNYMPTVQAEIRTRGKLLNFKFPIINILIIKQAIGL